MRKRNIPNQFDTYLVLTKRHLMVFFKDWSTVLFTFMVPIITLVVYLIFLRGLETDQIIKALQEYNITDKAIIKSVKGVADTWMIGGILAVSCITVSLNTNFIMIRDKQNGVSKDMMSSPINSTTIMLSYFTFNFLVTFVINFSVYLLCLIWLAFIPDFNVTGWNFFGVFATLILSSLSAALVTNFTCSFIYTESTMAPVVAIFSAAVGFLIGAYIPTGMLGSAKWIGYVTTFFPGTYSACLFRFFMMKQETDAVINQLINNYAVSEETINSAISNNFSYNIDFFGTKVEPSMMVVAILVFIAFFLMLNLIYTKKNFLNISHIKKKRSKK